MKLHLSKSNTKIGATYSVSLTPVTSCRPGIPCARRCYARRLRAGRPSCQRAWGDNLKLAQQRPWLYFGGIIRVLKRKQLKFFRWHVAGDILDVPYWRGMCWVTRETSGTQHLCFSKRWDLLTPGLLKLRPRNLTLVWSMWPGLPGPPDRRPRAWYWDIKDQDSRMPEPRDSRRVFVCQGNCVTCAAGTRWCWTMGSNQHVILPAH